MWPNEEWRILMKIKEGYAVRKFMDECMVLPVGHMADQKNMIIALSKTGAFIWEKLQQETTFDALLKATLDTFDVPEETAKADLEAFIQKLRKEGLLCE